MKSDVFICGIKVALEIDAALDEFLEEIQQGIESEGQPSTERLDRCQEFYRAHSEKVDRIGRSLRMEARSLLHAGLFFIKIHHKMHDLVGIGIRCDSNNYPLNTITNDQLRRVYRRSRNRRELSVELNRLASTLRRPKFILANRRQSLGLSFLPWKPWSKEETVTLRELAGRKGVSRGQSNFASSMMVYRG